MVLILGPRCAVTKFRVSSYLSRDFYENKAVDKGPKVGDVSLHLRPGRAYERTILSLVKGMKH